jgi:hypothetical protein|tara:strand:- start:4348 stop:4608 length:261 start_codon:yes stop_codon:yes gene_type:complete
MATKKITAYSVFKKEGSYERTYSEEVHGKAFQKNAESYTEKIGGKMREATEQEERGEVPTPAELREQKKVKEGEITTKTKQSVPQV